MKNILLSLIICLQFAGLKAQWEWINPNIPLVGIDAACYLEGGTYLVAAEGSILISHNYGLKWHTIALEGNPALRHIYFADPSTGYAVGDEGVILKTLNGGTEWQTLSTSHNFDLSWVYFANSDLGYAAGTLGRLLKTTNGGLTWQLIQMPVNADLYSVHFLDTDTGVTGGHNGWICKTSDGGETWTCTEENFWHIHQVFILDASTMIAASDGGIFRTTNGGSSWNQVLNTGVYNVYGFHKINSGRIFAAGGAKAIYSSDNDGQTWTTHAAPQDYYLGEWKKGIAFSDSNKGIITDYGDIHVIDLEQGSWSNQSQTLTNNSLYSTAFLNDTTLMAAGYGIILRSQTNGRSWQNIDFDFPGLWAYDMTFTSEQTGFICGGISSTENYGVILQTTDGGFTWQMVLNPPLSLRTIHFVSPEVGFAAGMSGYAFKTEDGGTTWTAMETGVTNGLFGIHFTDLNTGYICGTGGVILKTQNGGQTWSTLNSGVNRWLTDIYFISPTTGFISGASKTILRTQDGGTTWTQIPNLGGPYNRDLFSISFLTPEVGYICGQMGYIYKTIDGGQSWQYDPIHFSEYIYRCASGNPHTLVAVGTFGAILRNYSGPPENPLEEDDDDDDDDDDDNDDNTLAENLSTINNIRIWPNPAGDVLNIELNDTRNSILFIYNSTGQLIMEWDLQTGGCSIPLRELPRGIYLIRVADTNAWQVLKFLKL